MVVSCFWHLMPAIQASRLTQKHILTAGGEMYGTLFKGVIVGFFFPFLPLFFFRAAEGETPVFSKRMQMAIVAGLSINILYGALRAMN